MPKRVRQKHTLIVLIVIFLILVGVLLERLDLPVASSTLSLRKHVAAYGVFAPLIYIAIMTLAIVIVPLPDFIPGLAAGLLFPWYLATVYTLIADFLGSSIAFYLARIFGRPFVVRLVREKELAELDQLAMRLGGKTIFILRLIPGFNFDLIAYVAGLTPIRYSIFILATLVGVLPRRLGTYLIVDKGIIVDPVVLFMGILVSMIITPIGVYWLWKGRAPLDSHS